MDSAERTASRRVFTGRVFSVDVDTVTMPHGVTVELEVIRHPASVVLLPETADGRIILVRQYRYAVDRWLWELPAGSSDPGESPDEAAVRECAEEIRLVAESVERLGTFFPTPGFCDEPMVFFRLTGLRPPRAGDPEAHLDPDEDLEIRAFPPDEIHALIARGELQDMKTIVGMWLGGSGRASGPVSSTP